MRRVNALIGVVLVCVAPAGVAAGDEKDAKDAATEIAAAAPANDIYVASLERGRDGARIGRPRNVTHRPGYDNQPFFLPDGKRLYYTSIREDGQADIWRLDVESGESQQVTHTKESEYSPSVPPDRDGISTVRVEKDGSQRLWRYDADGTPRQPIVKDEKAVGYHAWIDEDTLALFIVAEPPVLKQLDLRGGRSSEIAHDVGRCIQAVPARPAVAFIEPDNGKPWIKLMQWPAGLTRPLTEPLEDSEDFVFDSSGELYMARERAIYQWQHEAAQWKAIADFSSELPGPISRLAVNPRGDLIAFVVAEAAEPQQP
jgi:dipeptidyl aminopeptidase/acylaminoacyl peptidase